MNFQKCTMRTQYDALEAAKQIKLDVMLKLSVFDSEEDFARLQAEQMMAGKRSDDKQIFNVHTGSPEYSYQYAKYKGKDEPIDLNDTGSFQHEIFLETDGENFRADSRDEKSEMLQGNYGTEIFGLAEERHGKWLPFVQTHLVENLSEEMNK